MRTAQIEIINACECCIPRQQARYIMGALEYQKVAWSKGQRGMRQETYSSYFFTFKGRNYFHFMTGHLSRVLKHCRKHNVKAKVIGKSPSQSIPKPVEPHLESITLREDQFDALTSSVKYKRGVVKAPTRTGKTVIQYGIVSMYPGINTLFVVHSLDLVEQIADEGKKFGFNVAIVHGKKKELDWAEQDQVVVMTRSTAKKMIKDNPKRMSQFKMVIVDEGHHIISPDGEYAQILINLPAPLRFAFTATLPDTVEGLLTLEGLIGPVIEELTIQSAIEKGLLVNPKIQLVKGAEVKIPVRRNYAEVYEMGIVNNKRRNAQVAQISAEYNVQNKSVLILITKIDHGHNLEDAFRAIGHSVVFVRGETSSDDRKRIKKEFIKKEIMCVIATSVWKEGVNIPTLDVCINAGCGKSEIGTLQGVGRSLTKTKDKEQAIIVDIFDSSHYYLIKQFGERITLYFEQGWM